MVLKRSDRKLVWLVMALIMGLGTAGCYRPEISRSPAGGADDEPVPGATPDTAQKAALVFMAVVAQKTNPKVKKSDIIEQALPLILPADREQAREMFEKADFEFPDIPRKDIDVRTFVKGPLAKVRVENPGFNVPLNLKFVEGKWWVCIGAKNRR